MTKKHFLSMQSLRKPLHSIVWVGVLCVVTGGIYSYVMLQTQEIERTTNSAAEDITQNNAALLALYQKRTAPVNGIVEDILLPVATLPKIDINRMKQAGCITDGFLSGYGDEERNVKLINRLSCYYLHRAVETWLSVPDWEEVDRIKGEVTRRPVIYGMFIAEAINTKSDYINNETGDDFHFKKMCKPGTDGRWGKNTCVPDFNEKEYRAYVVQIIKEAIDHGVQAFLIGQVQVQDARHLDNSDIEGVLKDVRAYAARQNVDIVVGAQTNDTTDKDYLRLFDFIEGGVGLHADGSIEDGPCFSRYLEQSNWCWALLWHENYAKANNRFIHLDWSGMHDDDMATFTLMDSDLRARTLRFLHSFYTNQNIGFLLPVFTALPYDHNGCYGNKERYYSADRKYSCDDEDVIEDILTNSI